LALGTQTFHGASNHLEKAAQLIRVESGVVEDAGERASLELAVQRHCDEDAAVGMLQPNMAAALTDRPPAGPFEGFHEALTGEDR
jgi:hypothetical protein